MNRFKRTIVCTALMGSLSLAPLTGCSNLPGNSKEQGAVIGGVGGAAAGAALAKGNRGLGAVIGGLLGAGAGYLIGAQKDKMDDDGDRDDAQRAAERAIERPARASDVARARTADLNDDGYVTLDEVVAMQEADLTDSEMIDRLEATQQVFNLNEAQEEYLLDKGVSQRVIREMRGMNQDLARTAGDDDRDRDDRYDDDRYDDDDRLDDRDLDWTSDRDRTSDRDLDDRIDDLDDDRDLDDRIDDRDRRDLDDELEDREDGLRDRRDDLRDREEELDERLDDLEDRRRTAR